jgi:hypothetical protein
MWFPPYDIKFTDASRAIWTPNSFLGRPEPIYTYKDTSREGTLSWKIIVDHPSVMNVIVEKQLKGQNKERINSIIDSFFAGCVKYDIYELAKKFNTVPTKDLYTYQQILNNPNLDTNTAKEIENWFEKINPFEEAAEAQTIGRITKAIASVAPVGVGGAVLGARVGKLAKTALEAKKTGNTFSLANFGAKLAAPLPSTIIGGGIGESIVSDTEIGTFADMLRGTSLEPYALTMMDIEDKEGRSEAYRKLLNRVKFGTEGALFNLALIGAGKGIGKLRNPSETGLEEYSQDPTKRFFQKYFTLGSVGNLDRESFIAQRATERNIEMARSSAYDLTNELQKSLKGSVSDVQKEFFPNLVLGSKELEENVNKKITNILSSKDNKLLDLDTLKKRVIEESNGDVKKIANDINIDISDYKGATERSKEFNDLIQTIKNSKGGGENAAKLFENTILNMRLAVDSLSLNALKKGLSKK